MTSDFLVIVTIVLSIVFTFVNGFHDGGNVFATAVASRTLSPGKALAISCIAELLAPLVLGTAVADTIGRKILDISVLASANHQDSILLILAALLGAILWNFITWKAGLPSSSSHALVGGLIGAGVAMFGFKAVLWASFFRGVVLLLLAAPLLGFLVGYIMIRVTKKAVSRSGIGVNKFFRSAQIFGIITLAASHSTNDAQKSMGVIALILLISGNTGEFFVPAWVMAACALAISMGLSLGGWTIVKTVGTRIFRMKPIHSFNSQLASSLVILTAGFLGSPVSSTQTVSSSIMGTGAGERMNAVQWETVNDILLSWILTIPSTAVIACILCLILKNVV